MFSDPEMADCMVGHQSRNIILAVFGTICLVDSSKISVFHHDPVLRRLSVASNELLVDHEAPSCAFRMDSQAEEALDHSLATSGQFPLLDQG